MKENCMMIVKYGDNFTNFYRAYYQKLEKTLFEGHVLES